MPVTHIRYRYLDPSHTEEAFLELPVDFNPPDKLLAPIDSSVGSGVEEFTLSQAPLRSK